MSSDQYLPTACDGCNRIWLAPPRRGGLAKCRFCNGPACVVPGESYRTRDLSPFERIEGAVHTAQLSDVTSQRLWATLGNVPERRRRPELLLRAVLDALPRLALVPEMASEDRAQLSHALGMLLVVMSARLRAGVKATAG